MRFTAIIPVLCCTAALILSFLCLFAGHKQSFMEDYHLVTLNTSLLGQTLLPGSDSSPSEPDSSNPITNLLNSIPDRISDSVTDTINDAIGTAAEKLGIEDFYSAHMLNYCGGQYTPVEVANATVSEDDISKNVTECSKTQAMYRFDPTQIIEEALNKTTGLKVSLKDLKWPEDIQTGIDALNAVMSAMFVLYVLAIIFIFIALVTSVIAILSSGRLSACINVVIAVLAFLAIGLASALVTAVMVKAAEIINQYGNDIGVEAYWGGKFLALTWAATGLMLIVLIAWVVETCIGRRSRNKRVSYAKEG